VCGSPSNKYCVQFLIERNICYDTWLRHYFFWVMGIFVFTLCVLCGFVVKSIMKIGIITVRDNTYHPNGRLLQAAAERGQHAVLLHPYRMWPKVGENGLGFEGQTDPGPFDVILPRQGATIGESSLTLIHHLSRMGVPLVNGYEAVCLSRSQIMTLQILTAKKLPVPDTIFVNSRKGVRQAVAAIGGYPVVVKQVSGRQGTGTQLLNNETVAESIFTDDFDNRTGILLQRFIPVAGRQDIRVLVVGQKILGAMEMKPKDGDFRANYHLTQESRSIQLTPTLEDMALKAARAIGLDIAGVDLIIDAGGNTYVIEMNYSPGFNGFEKATGLDVAGKIIDFAVAKAEDKRS